MLKRATLKADTVANHQLEMIPSVLFDIKNQRSVVSIIALNCKPHDLKQQEV